ncbi:MAG: bifunctional heptose 7-phosphate kinase/heptose 1-phosphate adenyltransferase, partial [Alphaproteobacteria bacterium]|nr:bifunctional heptose 7-phosphate kinase/heptose 1-phosphate adenyltransferase [Alphaproteobacteria bacterium]
MSSIDFSHATILCLGDIMLDRFAYCDTERISPEAPVPVLLLKRTQSMLGGVGNVARNIAALGGTAVLMGLLGQDQAGDEVRALIGATAGIVDGHAASAGRPTICKTRYIAGHQQLVRVDEESPHNLAAAEEAALAAALDRHLADCNAVILSDYAKGTLAPSIIETAIARADMLGIPVYVDPKSTDFGHYRGAACIAPNLRELAAA